MSQLRLIPLRFRHAEGLGQEGSLLGLVETLCLGVLLGRYKVVSLVIEVNLFDLVCWWSLVQLDKLCAFVAELWLPTLRHIKIYLRSQVLAGGLALIFEARLGVSTAFSNHV